MASPALLGGGATEAAAAAGGSRASQAAKKRPRSGSEAPGPPKTKKARKVQRAPGDSAASAAGGGAPDSAAPAAAAAADGADGPDESDGDEAAVDQAAQSSFASELAKMMYAYGDAPHPLEESVELLDSMVRSFMANLVQRAVALGSGPKVTVDDLLLALHHDPAKRVRALNILEAIKTINDVRNTTVLSKKSLTEAAKGSGAADGDGSAPSRPP